MVKLSTSINLTELEENELFFTLVSLLCGEATDSLQFTLDLLFCPGWFFIKLLDELGSYSRLPPSNTFPSTKGNKTTIFFMTALDPFTYC